MPDYRFTVIVSTDGTKRYAQMALMSAFGQRKPDGCSYEITKDSIAEKAAYVSGSNAGVGLGFELALRSIENQMKTLGFERTKK